MKQIIGITLILCASCTTIKYARQEKLISEKACMSIMPGNVPLVKVQLEGKEQSFLFDTGAMVSVLTDSLAIEGFSKKKFASFGWNKGAEMGKRIPNRIFTTQIKTPVFNSQNKVMLFSVKPKTKCHPEYYSGILGLDAFFNNHEALKLDFSRNEICNIDTDQMQTTIQAEQFVQIKSECKTNQVYIFMQIKGKEHRFTLDTGYTGSIMLPFDKSPQFAGYNRIDVEGSLFKTNTAIIKGHETFYENVPVMFAGASTLTKIAVSTSIKGEIAGMIFIRGYDWLIDHEHNKVYVKRNQNKIESNFNRKVSCYVLAGDGLTIIAKEVSQTQYHIGDQIIAVNGTKVTPENICEMQDLLNKTEDWITLQLEVIPKA